MQRITYSAACVLHALSNGVSYGLDIMERTNLPSGTVYPMLRRFEHAGLVSSDWETPQEAFADRRPQRRHYELTDAGLRALVRATERYRRQLEFMEDAGPEPSPVR